MGEGPRAKRGDLSVNTNPRPYHPPASTHHLCHMPTLCRVQRRILFEYDDPTYASIRRAGACACHHRLKLATADGVNPIRTGEPWPSRVNRMPAPVYGPVEIIKAVISSTRELFPKRMGPEGFACAGFLPQ
jgi:hypothetical protein